MDIKPLGMGIHNPVEDLRQQALDLIGKMRTMNNDASAPAINATPGASETQRFSQLFTDAISSVNKMQTQAEQLQKGYELGDPAVNLTQVVTATQSADVSFRLLMGIRNRAISAYREIMSMPV